MYVEMFLRHPALVVPCAVYKAMLSRDLIDNIIGKTVTVTFDDDSMLTGELFRDENDRVSITGFTDEDDDTPMEPFSTYLDWEAAADPWLFIAVFCRNDAERAAIARDIKEARK